MAQVDVDRLKSRGQLRQSLDQIRRDFDQKRVMDSMDSFQRQALNMMALEEAIQRRRNAKPIICRPISSWPMASISISTSRATPSAWRRR